jgi:glutaredoxin-like protein NrdH
MITVYSKPSCPGCDATKRLMDKLGIDYDEHDVTTDEYAMAYIKELGFSSAPVVVTDDDSWSGFRPDRIDAIEGGR